MRLAYQEMDLNLKFQKSFFLMQAQLTEFLLRLTFEGGHRPIPEVKPSGPPQETNSHSSAQILNHIYAILNSQKNYKPPRSYKMSMSSEESTPQSPLKCNCKKSKCLKLYCECFSKGQFCKDCNCEGCQNTEEFSEIRAKAIDEMLTKTSAFGVRQTGRGCNCKKTGCQKKYCQCYNSGQNCSELCKCSNCENCT